MSSTEMDDGNDGMDDGRKHVKSGLMRESLVSKALMEETDHGEIRRMLPDVNFIAIGGESIIDRGAEALFPLVDVIAKLAKRHKLVIGASGGIRVWHTYSIALDLGIPVGGLAKIMGGIEEQNRDVLQFLLSPHGGISFMKDHFNELPMFLGAGLIPICVGQPPYHQWEPPPKEGRVPENGPDVGLFLMAEVLGAARMIYVKDIDGIFLPDSGDGQNAKMVTEVTAKSLLDMDLPDLPIERELLRCVETSRLLRECYVINGLKPETLERLLEGDQVGTRITRSQD